MDSFFGLLLSMGASSMFFDNWSPDFDVIGALPLEVAIIILRKLDGKSLLNAAQVSTKWLRIIKFDRVLRTTVRKELARQRQEKLKRHMGPMDHVNEALSTVFYPEAKKRKRVFDKSVKTTERKSQTKKSFSSSISTAQLRKMR